MDQAEEQKQQERWESFSSLKANKGKEEVGERKEKEKEIEVKKRRKRMEAKPVSHFPHFVDEGEIITVAIVFADLSEIKLWVLRGGDVNAPIPGEFDKFTPLELLANRFDEKESQIQSQTMTFLTFSGTVKGRDFLDVAEFLVLVGAEISDRVWKEAMKGTRKTQLLDSLCRLGNTTLEQVKEKEEARRNLTPEGVKEWEHELEFLSVLKKRFDSQPKDCSDLDSLVSEARVLYSRGVQCIVKFSKMLKEKGGQKFQQQMEELYAKYQSCWYSLGSWASHSLSEKEFKKFCEQSASAFVTDALESETHYWTEFLKTYYQVDVAIKFNKIAEVAFSQKKIS